MVVMAIHLGLPPHSKTVTSSDDAVKEITTEFNKEKQTGQYHSRMVHTFLARCTTRGVPQNNVKELTVCFDYD